MRRHIRITGSDEHRAGLRAVRLGMALLLAGAAAFTLIGCHEDHVAVQDQPVRHDPDNIPPPIRTISPADLGVPSQMSVTDVLTRMGGSGRIALPAAMAVARVGAVDALDRADKATPVVSATATGSGRLDVEAMSLERSAMWNNVANDLPSLREVAVLRTLGLDPRGVGVEDILREAGRQECNLCLIFTIEEEAGSANVLAVLWNAAAHEPLARIAFNETARPLPEKDDSKAKRLSRRRKYDAAYLAEVRLREVVGHFLWDLSREGTPTTTQPNPWQSDTPVMPRDHSSHRRFYRWDTP